MKKLHSVKMLAMLTVLAASSVQARNDDCEGPLDSGRWYIMPKIGVAPGIFAGRGYEQRVQILGGSSSVDRTVSCLNPVDGSACATVGACVPVVSTTNQYNAFQQNSCKNPKFNEIFSNGVLHVGFEVGRNVCDNVQMYLEFVYDRASGKCLTNSTSNYAAPEGCVSDDCSTSCSTPAGNLLSTSTRTSKFDNYAAYGLFIGARHYCNWSLFCDRIALWGGFKAGFLHRNAVNACINIPAVTVGTAAAGYTFAARENINKTIFCKSNAVAAGASLGFDYCFSDCLTLLVGAEVVASCAFKSNPNIRLDLAANPTVNGQAPVAVSGAFPQPTNIIIGTLGTLVQFPVWVGFRWEFDFCRSAC